MRFAVPGSPFAVTQTRFMSIRRFEDIESWQMGREISRQVYDLARDSGIGRDFSLNLTRNLDHHSNGQPLEPRTANREQRTH